MPFEETKKIAIEHIKSKSLHPKSLILVIGKGRVCWYNNGRLQPYSAAHVPMYRSLIDVLQKGEELQISDMTDRVGKKMPLDKKVKKFIHTTIEDWSRENGPMEKRIDVFGNWYKLRPHRLLKLD